MINVDTDTEINSISNTTSDPDWPLKEEFKTFVLDCKPNATDHAIRIKTNIDMLKTVDDKFPT